MKLHDFQFFTLETLIIQSVIIFIILWVLNKYVFKPYLAYIDEWDSQRKKLEDDYKNIKVLIKDAEEQKEYILLDAKNKADLLVKEAEHIAKQKKAHILDSADKEAKGIMESWKLSIEKERLSMLNWVKTKLVDLIVWFNKKIFINEPVNRDYIEKSLAEIK